MEKRLIKRLDLIGVPVDCVKKEDMEDVLLQLLENGEHNQIIFLDLKRLLFARRNEEFRQILHDAALVLPLDKSITHGLYFLHKVQSWRYLPYDFIINSLTLLEYRCETIYLLGSSKKIIQVADRNLRSSFPRLLFVGRHAGYFKKDVLDHITEAIRKSSPSFLIYGRGLRGQDRWVHRLNERFNPGIAVYDHNFFDIIAGKSLRPSAEAFESGYDQYLNILKKPWLVLSLFSYLRYIILLLIYRSKKKRG